MDEAEASVRLTAGERDDALGQVARWTASCSARPTPASSWRSCSKNARAEARANEERAISAEHSHQARSAELVAAGHRIADLTSALDQGRASVEGTRGELARAEAGRAEAERRAAEAAAASATRWRARWRRPAARPRRSGSG